MERIFAGTDKIILDSGSGSGGVVPYLPLSELRRAPAPQQPAAQPQNGATR
jgi:membrane protease subunit HflK